MLKSLKVSIVSPFISSRAVNLPFYHQTLCVHQYHHSLRIEWNKCWIWFQHSFSIRCRQLLCTNSRTVGDCLLEASHPTENIKLLSKYRESCRPEHIILIYMQTTHVITQHDWSFVWKTLLDDGPKPHVYKFQWNPWISCEFCGFHVDSVKFTLLSQNHKRPLAHRVTPLYFLLSYR